MGKREVCTVCTKVQDGHWVKQVPMPMLATRESGNGRTICFRFDTRVVSLVLQRYTATHRMAHNPANVLGSPQMLQLPVTR